MENSYAKQIQEMISLRSQQKEIPVEDIRYLKEHIRISLVVLSERDCVVCFCKRSDKIDYRVIDDKADVIMRSELLLPLYYRDSVLKWLKENGFAYCHTTTNVDDYDAYLVSIKD